MAPSPCAICHINRALIVRPKNHAKLCKACFLTVFEDEIHQTVTSTGLFRRGEQVAIGASGGKDSTVLASVLKTLNERHDYGLELLLLSVDEGIRGYRDDSLETVKRNASQYGMPLTVVGYDRLYGWTMDQVVEQVGKRGNCTYCGVFRRQALDRGAAMLGVGHVVTGHNADDMAETVLMNLLRGDLPRLSRTTSIVTTTPSQRNPSGDSNTSIVSMTNVKRSKPLKYAYEKEIVLYAHHKQLDYFSTECIYSPEAFRGSARALIKNLERIRPSAILDIVRSGEDMARLVPGFEDSCPANCGSGMVDSGAVVPAAITGFEEEDGGCGSSKVGLSIGGEMRNVEEMLARNEKAEELGLEIEIGSDGSVKDPDVNMGTTTSAAAALAAPAAVLPPTSNPVKKKKESGRRPGSRKTLGQQKMRQCSRCGYLSSQIICKACVLLEGLNKNRPKVTIATTGAAVAVASSSQADEDLVKQLPRVHLVDG